MLPAPRPGARWALPEKQRSTSLASGIGNDGHTCASVQRREQQAMDGMADLGRRPVDIDDDCLAAQGNSVTLAKLIDDSRRQLGLARVQNLGRPIEQHHQVGNRQQRQHRAGQYRRPAIAKAGRVDEEVVKVPVEDRQPAGPDDRSDGHEIPDTVLTEQQGKFRQRRQTRRVAAWRAGRSRGAALPSFEFAEARMQMERLVAAEQRLPAMADAGKDGGLAAAVGAEQDVEGSGVVSPTARATSTCRRSRVPLLPVRARA